MFFPPRDLCGKIACGLIVTSIIFMSSSASCNGCMLSLFYDLNYYPFLALANWTILLLDNMYIVLGLYNLSSVFCSDLG